LRISRNTRVTEEQDLVVVVLFCCMVGEGIVPWGDKVHEESYLPLPPPPPNPLNMLPLPLGHKTGFPKIFPIFF
jgi:hypothetical protein